MIQWSNLQFRFDENNVFAFADHTIARGERVLIQGESGSGKTTLLSLLTGVLTPSAGNIRIQDTDITQLSSGKRDHFRKHNMGYVFQQFNLLEYLTLEENVALPLSLSQQRANFERQTHATHTDAARAWLSKLSLNDSSLFQKPARDVSFGQKQRVAVARACIGNPPIILADEPTSSLDASNKKQLMDVLTQHCQAHNTTLVMVSHETDIQSYFDRSIAMQELLEVA